MTASIAWIAATGENPATTGTPPPGQWGHPSDLSLPLNDRGLLLADGLFETVLLEGGKPLLLKEHLERWRQSARLLGMATPPDAAWIIPVVAEAVARSGIQTGALRLNWTRGSGGRGLDLPSASTEPASHRFWLQLSATTPRHDAVTTWISRQERRNAASRLSHCKSFAYAAQVQARREAHDAGAQDGLLLSTSGELCCGTAANLLVCRQGEWLTPPLTSGCLPGVMRGRALLRGRARESSLEPGILRTCDGAVLINSLGCRPIHRCDGHAVGPISSKAAEQLWRSLLP